MASDFPSSAASTLGATTATTEAAATESAQQRQQTEPMRWRELVALSVWTLLADFCVFRALGFSGPALFIASAPMLFVAREFAGKSRGLALVIVVLLWLAATRLAWSGSSLAVFSGFTLVFALAMVVSGYAPLVLEMIAYALRVLIDGLVWIFAHRLPERMPGGVVAQPAPAATWLLPCFATAVFGGIFVLANPNLMDWVSDRFSLVADRLWIWLEGSSFWELPFCLTAFVLGAGLLRPLLPMRRIGPVADCAIDPAEPQPATWYAAYRNTLLTLIVLFGCYLAFEFHTLWRRDFPPGFYYAGYAHQGAAWLTFALALATGLLSMVFSGATLKDPRLSGLRLMAWLWSAQNFLLAAAVYNRLMIYVGYNGMTRLRTVGFFGITVVVIGFVLVLYKIAANRGFWWLIRAQLVALMLTVIVYSLFPVDLLAHRYNATQVKRGYLHPSVMIAVKPMEDEGYFPVIELLDVPDPIIREGVLAMLAQRQLEIKADSQGDWHWTRFQGSTHLLYQRLRQHETAWSEYLDGTADRRAAIESFQNYAMQWY